MKVITCAGMKAAEECAFARGVTADSLMEEAGLKIARAVRQFFPRPGVCVAVFGKGNNGGDALVAARHLAAWGWEVHLLAAFPEEEWSALPRAKFAALPALQCIAPAQLATVAGDPLIVLDGLLGIGARGPLSERVSAITQAINTRRLHGNAAVFALDLPTGLDGDTGAADPGCVVADFTLTIGFAKCGLVADGAASFVGRLAVLPLQELADSATAAQPDLQTAEPSVLAPLWPRRAFDTHKGDCGRVGVFAGSPGYVGAAVLCATAVVRAGAGLVTLYTHPDSAQAASMQAPPEVMVRALADPAELLQMRHDVFAIGPGLGAQPAGVIPRLVRELAAPMVLDADGLNAIAADPDVLLHPAGERVLTPHPGEMERLAPGSSSRPRRQVVDDFTRRYPCTLLLKGARTLVGKAGEPLSCNTTGTPGMAVGGMGDVLTGVIAALIGQHLRPYDAARLGAWLCGRAAEIAIATGVESEESLTPSALLDCLGRAFRDLRAGCC